MGKVVGKANHSVVYEGYDHGSRPFMQTPGPLRNEPSDSAQRISTVNIVLKLCTIKSGIQVKSNEFYYEVG